MRVSGIERDCGSRGELGVGPTCSSPARIHSACRQRRPEARNLLRVRADRAGHAFTIFGCRRPPLEQCRHSFEQAPRSMRLSGGASITTLPLGSRRTWSCEKNSRTSARSGHRGDRGRDRAVLLASGSGRSTGSNAVATTASPLRGRRDRLVPRFVGCLDQVVERVGDLVVEARRRRRSASSSATSPVEATASIAAGS